MHKLKMSKSLLVQVLTTFTKLRNSRHFSFSKKEVKKAHSSKLTLVSSLFLYNTNNLYSLSFQIRFHGIFFSFPAHIFCICMLYLCFILFIYVGHYYFYFCFDFYDQYHIMLRNPCLIVVVCKY